MEKFVQISRKFLGMNVATILRKYSRDFRFWIKFTGNLKYILNKILRIFGKNFENFKENFTLIIIKLIQFQYNLLKFWVNFKKIFSKFEKTQMQNG